MSIQTNQHSQHPRLTKTGSENERKQKQKNILRVMVLWTCIVVLLLFRRKKELELHL